MEGNQEVGAIKNPSPVEPQEELSHTWSWVCKDEEARKSQSWRHSIEIRPFVKMYIKVINNNTHKTMIFYDFIRYIPYNRKSWVGQKVRSGFPYHLLEKPERTFWPTSALMMRKWRIREVKQLAKEYPAGDSEQRPERRYACF